MRLLLDTQVIVWAGQEPDRIPQAVRSTVESAQARVVSAASVYEIAYKARRGKLPRGRAVLESWPRLVRDLRLEELPVSVVQMRLAGELPWEHGDPFDRMLVAQAQAEGLELVTADRRILAYDSAPTVSWDAAGSG